MPGELRKTLLKADDKLVPQFFKALVENNQPHVVSMLLRDAGD